MELSEDHQVFEFGAFRLDSKRKLVLRDQEVLPLTPKMVETLLALIEHSGQVVDKDVMMQRVWPDTFVEESNLTYNISILRRVLKSNDGNQLYIETVPKRGYRFVFPVKEVSNSGGKASTPSGQQSEGTKHAQPPAAELSNAEHESSSSGSTAPLTSATVESALKPSTLKSLAWIAAGLVFLVSLVSVPYIVAGVITCAPSP
jgi:DNA-binding winged helix-turn-helix (wHTH) protein